MEQFRTKNWLDAMNEDKCYECSEPHEKGKECRFKCLICKHNHVPGPCPIEQETGEGLEGYGYQDQVTDSRDRRTQAKGAADGSDQKNSDDEVAAEELVSREETVPETEVKSKPTYKGLLRKQQDQSSSSESEFSSQDEEPEDKVTDEDDDAMSDSERQAARERKAKKQEKKERKRLAKQERREQMAHLKREEELANAIRKWRETRTPIDYNVYPELDPHSEGAEVYEVPDDDEDEEQRQDEEDDTEYHRELTEAIVDAFSDKSSSEKTDKEKADWKTNEPKAAKKTRKAKKKAKARAKADQEAKAKRAAQARLQPFERPELERVRKESRQSSGD